MTSRRIWLYGCLCVVFLVAAGAARSASAQTVQLTIVATGPNTGAIGTNLGLCNRWDAGGPDQTCVFPVASGTTVTVRGNAPLGAPAALISARTGSAAGCTLNTSTCTFSITEDSSLTLVFDMALSALFRTMTVNLAGEGDGEVGADNNRCQTFDPLQFSACATSYGAGSVVTLQGQNLAGSRFLQFSNGTELASSCSSSPCSFAINNPTSVTATFARLTSLAVNPPSATVGVGQMQNFSATGTFVNGADVTTAPVQGNMGTWKFKAPMGTPRFALAAGALNGTLYAVGGVDGIPGHGPLTLVEAYDPSTNSWSVRAPLPIGREGLGVAVAGGLLYAISGNAPGATIVASVDAYDPGADSWSPRAPIPTARRSFGVGVIGGKVYVVGGEDQSGTKLATVEAYDPATDTWTARAPMPTARGWLGAAVVNGILYAVGGMNATNTPLSTVEAYDPVTDSWSAKPSMPSSRTIPAAASIDGVIYVVGGSSGGMFQSGAFSYDPAANFWGFKSSMPEELVGTLFESTARGELAAASMNGALYAVGGQAVRGVPSANVALPTLMALTDHLVWNTSDPGVASIRQFGQANGIAPGTATLTARTGSVTCLTTSSCGTLQVIAPVARDDAYTMTQGTTLTVPAPGLFANDTLLPGATLQIVMFPPGPISNTGGGGFTFTPNPSFSGVVTFTYRAQTFSGASNVATVTVTVEPVAPPEPIVDAGPDQNLECSSPSGAMAQIQGSIGFDPDTPITYTWTGPFGTASGLTPIVPVPLGSHLLTFTISDGLHSASDTVGITVSDTAPPAITALSAQPPVLWPPNHKMVPITLALSTADVCDASLACSIVSVTSSEPVNGLGDGDTAPDWQLTGPLGVTLRAERSGAGGGRLYTITVECRDDGGNTARRSVHVSVPHDAR